MTRRADLRRRRPDEYKTRVVDTVQFVSSKVEEIVRDIQTLHNNLAPTHQLSADARHIPDDFSEAFEIAITSPPYLNGTNYFRNTKLELWFLGYIKSEAELKNLYRQALAAGINNISSDTVVKHEFDYVESVAKTLDNQAPDARIPKLVRAYFSDMYDVLNAVCRALREGGRFVVDIGDSKFYGVHVPTDKLLIEVAKDAGFIVEEANIVARRYSRDKTTLQQTEIVLKKPKGATRGKTQAATTKRVKSSDSHSIKEAIEHFRKAVPYKIEPFSKRSWGHPLHSLCSYQGKLKPALAHWLVALFTEPGMSVLDPLGGVGTIGFEAALQGRKAISNDLSPLASVIATAKLSPPSLQQALNAVRKLEQDLSTVQLNQQDRKAAEFGLNAKVKDYFHEKTLEEVLKARRYFLGKKSLSNKEAFLKACLLHILHGNRPYALSRRSHPITPFHPSGPFEYKSLINKVEERIQRALSVALPKEFIPGRAYHQDFRNIKSSIPERVDRIITSPPFIGMRFDRPNWMRLWFCGWDAKDFHSTRERFLERQQMESFDVYSEFFNVCADSLTEKGLLILHVGGSKDYDMAQRLIGLAAKRFVLLDTVSENVQAVEKHGINDKGTTSAHHFLFFENEER
jgi:DNA modification methylase